MIKVIFSESGSFDKDGCCFSVSSWEFMSDLVRDCWYESVNFLETFCDC